MRNLQDLPTELLVKILSYLLPCELFTACRLSRRLLSISQSLLFRAPLLSTANILGGPNTPSSLETFYRTLTTPGNEALASHVLSLTLNWCNRYGLPLAANQNQPPHQSAQPTSHPTPTAPLPDVQNTCTKHLFNLLIRLRALHITSFTRNSSVGNFIDEYYINQPTSALPPAFHTLRDFYCHSLSSQFGISYSALMMLLLLPCIRSIDVDLVDNDDELPDVASTATSTVTTLRISHALFRARWLASILRVTCALTHFSFTARRIFECYRYRHIRSALELVRGTVQALSLNFEYVCSYPDEYPLQEGEEVEEGVDLDPALSLVPSFRGWPMLVRLRCPLLFLRGYLVDVETPVLLNVLPVGIRELEMLDESYYTLAEVVGELVELLRRREELSPLLKRVVVMMANGGPEYEILREECRVTGVELVEHGQRW